MLDKHVKCYNRMPYCFSLQSAWSQQIRNTMSFLNTVNTGQYWLKLGMDMSESILADLNSSSYSLVILVGLIFMWKTSILVIAMLAVQLSNKIWLAKTHHLTKGILASEWRRLCMLRFCGVKYALLQYRVCCMIVIPVYHNSKHISRVSWWSNLHRIDSCISCVLGVHVEQGCHDDYIHCGSRWLGRRTVFPVVWGMISGPRVSRKDGCRHLCIPSKVYRNDNTDTWSFLHRWQWCARRDTEWDWNGCLPAVRVSPWLLLLPERTVVVGGCCDVPVTCRGVLGTGCVAKLPAEKVWKVRYHSIGHGVGVSDSHKKTVTYSPIYRYTLSTTTTRKACYTHTR